MLIYGSRLSLASLAASGAKAGGLAQIDALEFVGCLVGVHEDHHADASLLPTGNLHLVTAHHRHIRPAHAHPGRDCGKLGVEVRGGAERDGSDIVGGHVVRLNQLL